MNNKTSYLKCIKEKNSNRTNSKLVELVTLHRTQMQENTDQDNRSKKHIHYFGCFLN